MFKKKRIQQEEKAFDFEEHPHLKSVALWNDLYGNAENRYRKSRMLNFWLAGLLSVSVIGLINIGSKSKFEPWLVALDGKSAINVGPLQKQKIADKNKNTLAEYFLKGFIKDAREISVDAEVDQNKITASYSFTNGGAFTQLKDYYKDNNKFELAKDTVVSIDKFNYIMPVSATTYKAKWLEVIRNSSTGNMLQTRQMVGEFQVSWETPSKNSVIFSNNPLGFYITNFSWVGEN